MYTENDIETAVIKHFFHSKKKHKGHKVELVEVPLRFHREQIRYL